MEYIPSMKKIILRVLLASAFLLSILSMLFFASVLIRPIGDVVFSLTMGNMYRKVATTEMKIHGKAELLSIYKAANKPFLLLGPYRFDRDYDDFFFVNREQVIRSALDKGGDAWFRLWGFLFIFDDMTCADRVRFPYWDDLECDRNSSVQYNSGQDAFVYSFRIRDLNTPISFSIPAKYLTPDMLDAPNDTRGDPKPKCSVPYTGR